MIKVTVLYGHPTDEKEFEKYYEEVHTPIALAIPNMERIELTKFMANPDGSNAAYYRMAELYFETIDVLSKSMGSAEGKATAGDLANFATGGVTLLTGEVM
ncbi:MAG: EthD family reductase [Chitinophagaceae bacterium]|nr:EthD family reductase [Chitinophagaceae bacterium]